MALIRYQPLPLVRDIQNEMNKMLERWSSDETTTETSTWLPAVDIEEKDDCYVLHADIPGIKPEEVEVYMDKGLLTIRGERKHEEKEEKENWVRIERSRGTFCRQFRLPDAVEPEKIEAKNKNGVLEITIPKTKESKARRIEVKSEE